MSSDQLVRNYWFIKNLYHIYDVLMVSWKVTIVAVIRIYYYYFLFGYFNVSQHVFLRYRIADDFVYVVMKCHLCVESRLSAFSAAILTSNGLIDHSVYRILIRLCVLFPPRMVVSVLWALSTHILVLFIEWTIFVISDAYKMNKTFDFRRLKM
jgi:hypothetical protein